MFSITACKSWLQQYNVLSSTQLQIMDFLITKNISLIKIIKSNDPNLASLEEFHV